MQKSCRYRQLFVYLLFAVRTRLIIVSGREDGCEECSGDTQY